MRFQNCVSREMKHTPGLEQKTIPTYRSLCFVKTLKSMAVYDIGERASIPYPPPHPPLRARAHMLVGQSKSRDHRFALYGPAPHLDHKSPVLVRGVEQIETATGAPTGGGERVRRRVHHELSAYTACRCCCHCCCNSHRSIGAAAEREGGGGGGERDDTLIPFLSSATQENKTLCVKPLLLLYSLALLSLEKGLRDMPSPPKASPPTPCVRV